MEIILILPVLISFLVTFFILPKWIKRARYSGLEGKDMNKYNKNKVAEVGGVSVLAGLIIGIFLYIAIKTFYFKDSANIIEIFAIVGSILILGFIGLIDDILGWKIGLGKRMRIILVIVAAIPLIIINSGHSDIELPFINGLDLGWMYPLIIIPVGIVGATTTFNMLAGYNGLETSQGILIVGALSIVAYITGSPWLALIGLIYVLCLVAFLYYNKFPAKIFPGDSLTYPLGGMIALMAILGNFEKIAIFFFIPYILEVFLKLRAGPRLNKESFAKPNRDNSLEMPYNKIYGVEHLAIYFLKKLKKNKKVYEKEVVHLINFFQLIVIVLGFIIFRGDLLKLWA